MGYLWDKEATESVMLDEVSPGPTTSFAENAQWSYRAGRAVELVNSSQLNDDDARAEQRAAIEEISGKDYDEALGLTPGEKQERELVQPYFGPSDYRSKTKTGFRRGTDAEEAAIERYRTSLSADQAARITPTAKLKERAKEIALANWEKNEDMAARARGWTGQFGQFAGMGGSFVEDPVQLASLGIGPAAGATLFRMAMVNAAANAGSVAVGQYNVQTLRKDLGLSSGASEAAMNVGMAAAAGAGITLGIGALAKGASKLGVKYIDVEKMQREYEADFDKKSPREQLEVFKKLHENKETTPEQDASVIEIENALDFREKNPLHKAVERVNGIADVTLKELKKNKALEAKQAKAAQKKQPKPVNALDLLRSEGGIKNIDGFLDGLGLSKKSKLFQEADSKIGKTPEEARAFLVEHKYLHESEDGLATTTPNDVYKILSDALQDKPIHKFSALDEIDNLPDPSIEKNELEAVVDLLRQRMEEETKLSGFEIPEKDYRLAAQLYQEGADSEEVVKRLTNAAEEAANAEHDARFRKMTTALDLGEDLPKFAQDGAEQKLGLDDPLPEYDYRSDPLSSESVSEIQRWREASRANIEDAGEDRTLFGYAREGEGEDATLSSALDEVDARENFLKDIESCR